MYIQAHVERTRKKGANFCAVLTFRHFTDSGEEWRTPNEVETAGVFETPASAWDAGCRAVQHFSSTGNFPDMTRKF